MAPGQVLPQASLRGEGTLAVWAVVTLALCWRRLQHSAHEREQLVPNTALQLSLQFLPLGSVGPYPRQRPLPPAAALTPAAPASPSPHPSGNAGHGPYPLRALAGPGAALTP